MLSSFKFILNIGMGQIKEEEKAWMYIAGVDAEEGV